MVGTVWFELCFTTDRVNVEPLSDLLTGAGAVSVSWRGASDAPVLEPAPGEAPLWAVTCVAALFARRDEVDTALRATGLAAHEIRVIEDRDWQDEWQQSLGVLEFGERLRVCQVEDALVGARTVAVVMAPGLAFGSGTHPTTAMCLRWLDGAVLDGCTLIDYGCGSGILAIAALKLGARRVCAVDHDCQALHATTQNAARNTVGEALQVCSPRQLGGEVADVLIANILLNPLVELAGEFSRRVAPGGRIVLSGILDDQVGRLAARYEKTFHLEAPVIEQGWACLAGRRRA